MSAIPAPSQIELSPAVKAILEVDTPKSQLLRHFLDFTETILSPDPAGIDRVVSPDARFHELEAIGYPRGPEGFKMFRRQVNAGEEMMGAPATGRKIRFGVHARGRFVGGKMAERWDRADFEDIKRQLTGPTQ